MEQLDFTITIGARGRVIPGEEFHANVYDRADEQFYAGVGPTPWIAVAWALDERAHRRAGFIRPAGNIGEAPTLTIGKAIILAKLAEHRDDPKRAVLEVEPAEPVRGRAAFGLALALVETTKKSAAARRSRAKKVGARG